MGKKNHKKQKINGYIPEAFLLLTQVLIIISCYHIFIKKSTSWLITTLAVSLTLGCVNTTILLFSIRPGKNSDSKKARHGPGFAISLAFILFVVTGVSVGPPALLMHSPFGAVLMFMSFGAGGHSSAGESPCPQIVNLKQR